MAGCHAPVRRHLGRPNAFGDAGARQQNVDRGQVPAAAAQDGEGEPNEVLKVIRVGQPLTDRSEQLEPAAGDDARRGFRRDVQNALDLAEGVLHWRVREGEVALLEEASSARGTYSA